MLVVCDYICIQDDILSNSLDVLYVSSSASSPGILPRTFCFKRLLQLRKQSAFHSHVVYTKDHCMLAAFGTRMKFHFLFT